MTKLLLAATAVVGLVLASMDPTLAAGKHEGFTEGDEATQGNSGKENTNANPDNEGQTETTYEGPKGQIDKENFECNNCEPIAESLPGKNR